MQGIEQLVVAGRHLQAGEHPAAQLLRPVGRAGSPISRIGRYSSQLASCFSSSTAPPFDSTLPSSTHRASRLLLRPAAYSRQSSLLQVS